MRQCLVLLIASTFLTTAPVVYQPVEAQTFFEKVFPRAAKRREERKKRERLVRERKRKLQKQRKLTTQKQASNSAKTPPKVKGATYKNYTAAALKRVPLTQLSKAFTAHEQNVLTTDALNSIRPEEALNVAVEVANQPQDDPQLVVSSIVAKPIPTQNEAENQQEQTDVLPIMRLSAGAKLLPSIAVKASKPLGKALIQFYKQNPYFLWVNEEGKPNARAQAVLEVLKAADDYGLKASDYAVDWDAAIFNNYEVVNSAVETVNDNTETVDDNVVIIDDLPPIPTDETFIDERNVDQDQKKILAAMNFEFKLTAYALRYLSDARNGVVNPNKISDYHDFSGINLNFKKTLQNLNQSQDVKAFLFAAHPQDKAFEALKQELVHAREEAETSDVISVKAGTFIRPGKQNAELGNVIDNIRRQADTELLVLHSETLASDYSDGVYRPDLVDLVKDFQRSQKLKADGIIGRQTLAKLVGEDPKAKVQKVILAMERLRWHPDRLGERRVFINQPAYKATYMENGQKVFSMRAVVGKPSNQTYFFHDTIEYVEFNPYWGVPRSILVNEMLPELRKNASYLDSRGYEVRDLKGRKITSSSVNWHAVGAKFPYNVRQLPGAKNALGELKIMFPNTHSIYMHDTPAKSLFKRSKRAFSHGCVRLAEPRKMAAAVLGSTIGSVSEKISRAKNARQRLARKMPVYVSYYTAWPNDEGDVEYFSDIYGRDKALQTAMKKERDQRG